VREGQPETDLVQELLGPVARAGLVQELAEELGVKPRKALEITQAFDEFVARPLRMRLATLKGRDLAKRNPMIYTARGVTQALEWVDRVLEDKETSAIEGHLGTWQEEVARIVSDGVKPGGAVDLQIDRDDRTVDLYAIQAAPNTKNAGSRRSDIEGLRAAARPLRAARRVVEMYIAVLAGRSTTSPLKAEPDIQVLGSDEFWERVSGLPDFRARLLRASVVLARLVEGRASIEVDRIREEAIKLFATDTGELDLEALANPPAGQRHPRTAEES
jgi:hypothetical protein